MLGLTSGGLVVPGYLALHLTQPARLLATLAVGGMTFAAVRYGFMRMVVLYGRRRFGVTILTGFVLHGFYTAGARVHAGSRGPPGRRLHRARAHREHVAGAGVLGDGRHDAHDRGDRAAAARGGGAAVHVGRRDMSVRRGLIRVPSWVQTATGLALTAGLAVVAAGAVVLPRWLAPLPSGTPAEVEQAASSAADRWRRAVNAVAAARGVAPGEALIGSEAGPLVTTLGEIEAKRVERLAGLAARARPRVPPRRPPAG